MNGYARIMNKYTCLNLQKFLCFKLGRVTYVAHEKELAKKLYHLDAFTCLPNLTFHPANPSKNKICILIAVRTRPYGRRDASF